jgi:hypothetical protein
MSALDIFGDEIAASAPPPQDRKHVARELIGAGFWLFPCAEGRKTPAVKEWQRSGTRDLAGC